MNEETELKEGEIVPQKVEPEGKPNQEGDTQGTKEEQMARYEESLKDSDWGHQPC